MTVERKEYQQGLYSFPYHYLPYEDRGVWRLSRSLQWGYEYLAIVDTVLDVITKKEPRTLLDFGCGDGRLIYEVSHRNELQRLVGVDVSRQALSYAQGFNVEATRNSGVEFYESLDLVQGTFDAIVAMETLEHLSDAETESVLRRLCEMMEEDGIFIVSVPTKNMGLNPKHFRHYNIQDVEDVIHGHFVVVNVSYVHKIGWRSNWIRRMVHNRCVTVEARPWLTMMTWLYKRVAYKAGEKDGSHLIVVLRKV